MTISAIGEEIVLNPIMQAQWICHEKKYWQKMQGVDGTQMALISGGVSVSMMDKIDDIKANYDKHTLPVLLLTAGKDKVVDNKGAREFFKHIKTPESKKQIKLFYNAYHQVHKEPQYKA